MPGPSKVEALRLLGMVGLCAATGVLGAACYDYFILQEGSRVTQMGIEIRSGWAGVREGTRRLFRKREAIDPGGAPPGETEDSSLR